MDNVLLFTEDDEEILGNYTLISKDNLNEKDYNKYLKDYPELAKEVCHIRLLIRLLAFRFAHMRVL